MNGSFRVSPMTKKEKRRRNRADFLSQADLFWFLWCDGWMVYWEVCWQLTGCECLGCSDWRAANPYGMRQSCYATAKSPRWLQSSPLNVAPFQLPLTTIALLPSSQRISNHKTFQRTSTSIIERIIEISTSLLKGIFATVTKTPWLQELWPYTRRFLLKRNGRSC